AIDHVIVTMSRPPRRALRRIGAMCGEAGVRLRTMPGLSDIAHGHVHGSRIRDIELEQVLGRDKIQVESCELHALLEGGTVMVTGAGGVVGSELARQIAKFAP